MFYLYIEFDCQPNPSRKPVGFMNVHADAPEGLFD